MPITDDTLESLKELEKPLLRIESLFRKLASNTGGKYLANLKDQASRRVDVRRGRLAQCICVSVVTTGENFRPGPNNAAYVFWGGAWWDVADGRWWWHMEFGYWPVIPATDNVRAQMRTAWREVQLARKRDMEFSRNPYKKHK